MSDKSFNLGDRITLGDLFLVSLGEKKVSVTDKVLKKVAERRKKLEALLDSGKTMYGINTGFGELASQRVSKENLKTLQVNLIRSHSCGVGEPLEDDEVRAMMFARVNELAMGNSGVRPVVLTTLAAMINNGVIPYIPSKGSVGASGDLAPSAHMALTMIGEGYACLSDSDGDWLPSAEIMKKAEIEPIELAEKEGLALINGTQAMPDRLRSLTAAGKWPTGWSAFLRTILPPAFSVTPTLDIQRRRGSHAETECAFR